MPDHPCSRLPDRSSWCFDEIVRSERDRALSLDGAEPPGAILKALKNVLDQSINFSDVRMGRDHAKD